MASPDVHTDCPPPPPSHTAARSPGRTARALQISKSAADRLAAVNVCVASATAEITALKESGTAPGGLLRSKQNNMRLMKREIGAEQMIVEQTMKMFTRHCARHYTPPS